MKKPRRGRRRKIDIIIAARKTTHGDFRENTKFMQSAKDLMRAAPNWAAMPAYQREGLDMIMHKIGRVLYGDFMHEDHIADVAGYAERVRELTVGDGEGM